MTITYITPDAELDDLIARNEAGTARMVEILNAEETITTPPAPPRAFPTWVIAFIATSVGFALGVATVALM